ncbi:DUF742 domain-containing protein [Nocardiopsis coralliicola]
MSGRHGRRREGGGGMVDGGALLRPFAVRAGSPAAPAPGAPAPPGRTGPDVLATVAATERARPETEPAPEVARILRACAAPRRLADLAAEAELPLALVRHLVAGLVEEGRLRTAPPPRPGDDVLGRVLEGLRAL